MAEGMSEGARALDDGVLFQASEEYYKLAIPRKTVPRSNQSDLKLNDAATKKNDGVGVYEVAKSIMYAYVVEKLPDGTVITVSRRRPIPYAKRQEIYAAAVAKGLHVLPLKQPKDGDEDGPARRVNIDDL